MWGGGKRQKLILHVTKTKQIIVDAKTIGITSDIVFVMGKVQLVEEYLTVNKHHHLQQFSMNN